MALELCGCADPGCPVHKGDSHCERTATQTLYRVDMMDQTGTPMCDDCAEDAYDSGLFHSEPAGAGSSGDMDEAKRKNEVEEWNPNPTFDPECPQCGDPVWDHAGPDQALNKCWACGHRWMSDMDEEDDTKLARWVSRSGKHWVELHKTTGTTIKNALDPNSKGGEPFTSYSYTSPTAGGNLGGSFASDQDAITALEKMISTAGYFQPDAAKTQMTRESAIQQVEADMPEDYTQSWKDAYGPDAMTKCTDCGVPMVTIPGVVDAYAICNVCADRDRDIQLRAGKAGMDRADRQQPRSESAAIREVESKFEHLVFGNTDICSICGKNINDPNNPENCRIPTDFTADGDEEHAWPRKSKGSPMVLDLQARMDAKRGESKSTISKFVTKVLSEDFNEKTGEPDAEELQQWIENDGDLYRQQFMPIILNVKRRIKNGSYDASLAPKLWRYLTDTGAKSYAAAIGVAVASTAVRQQAADAMASEYYQKILNGEYD